jgi:hypothetical protein
MKLTASCVSNGRLVTKIRNATGLDVSNAPLGLIVVRIKLCCVNTKSLHVAHQFGCASFRHTHIPGKKAANVDSESGIGWSPAGTEKYNMLYELVIKDREARGVAFNDALLVYYLERRQNKKSKPDRAVNAGNRKAIPRDDLHTFDASYQNVLVPEFFYTEF